MSQPPTNLFQKTIEEKGLLQLEELEEEIEQASEPAPKSNRLRNILLGSGAAAIGLFLFSKRSKASTKDVQLTLEADMKLTPNFSLGEFLISSEMPELKQYQLSQKELNNVTRVANQLQDARDQYKENIFVTSGGRPSTLVRQEGKYKGLNFVQILAEKGYAPAAFSQHMDFSAADFTATNKNTLLKIFMYLKAAGSINPSPITQVGLYIEDKIPNFIHMGVVSDLNDFTKLKNKFYLAKVETWLDADGKKRRKTDFFPYSREKLDELLDIAS